MIDNRLVRNNYRFSNCLDLGCGTGVLGTYLVTKDICEKVVFIDNNPLALENTLENAFLNRISHRSMLIQIHTDDLILVNRFDLAVANPPYLPGEPVDLYDSAFLTGINGYETVVSFIKTSYRLLRENGLLYIIYSSLTNTSVVNNVLNKYFRVINKFSKRFFLEEIYVVEARRK